MSDRNLDHLQPGFAVKVRALLAAAKADGLRVMVTDGLRTFDEQAAIYAQGRTKPGKIVTKAKPGQSMHNYGLAVDLCFLDDKGKATWSEKMPWSRLGGLGEKVGLEWGGRWTSIVDKPHFQERGWTVAKAQATWPTGWTADMSKAPATPKAKTCPTCKLPVPR